MPPEEPGSVTVLDCRFEDGKLLAKIERLLPGGEWLRVSWASAEPPEGYEKLGGGVVAVDARKKLKEVVRSTGTPDRLGPLQYGWREHTNEAGLMLVLVLPVGYSLAAATPLPEAAKVFGDERRIAVYWMLTAQNGRTAARWTLVPLPQSAESEVEQLNARFYGAGDRVSPGWVFIAEPTVSDANRKVCVFVSYSHRDRDYVDALLRFLSGLEQEGFKFWHDVRIKAGEPWDDTIRRNIENAQIALIIVSQDFLNSRYAREEEVARFLKQRKENGLILFPLLLSPCDWKSVEWLSQTQVVPRDDKTIKTHFKEEGERDALFLTVLQELRAHGKRIRGDPQA